MTKIYGSDTDVALRILMLLAVHDRAVNIDRMISCDFSATYGGYFGIAEQNLHGDNEYSFGELSVRRMTAFRAIKYLVTQGLIQALDTENGFVYRISDSGRDIVGNMKSEYAMRYQRDMKLVLRKWGNSTDKELRDLIDLVSRNKNDEG